MSSSAICTGRQVLTTSLSALLLLGGGRGSEQLLCLANGQGVHALVLIVPDVVWC